VTTTRRGVRQHWREVLGTFLKVGALNYGGASVGIIQAEVQEQRGWISKAQFLEGLALVNTLPGPSGIQIGIFVADVHLIARTTLRP
jgi:chromate transport protein ChrA